MRKLFTFIAALLLTTIVIAQSPEKMSYQAVIRDAENKLVIKQTVGMQISILQGGPEGTPVYVETQEPTTNASGLVSIEIGGGTEVSGSFSSIEWSAGNYFINTETDPEGGTEYSIEGTSQLLSVPYALHATSAEKVNESDPTFSISQAANITIADMTNLGNLSGINSGDQDISGIVLNTQAIKDSAAQIRADIPDVEIIYPEETDPTVPVGTQPGQLQYWDGAQWVTIEAGSEGQVLTIVNGVPAWGAQLEGWREVENPVTGKTWMDRNLGASRAATSTTDADAYGYLYQWGRGTDGHESRTSGTTDTYSNSDTPGHNLFITRGDNWRSPKNDSLWQGLNGINNPCPSGFRLPTKAEWEAEVQTWSSYDVAGAFASPLKLLLTGQRNQVGSIVNPNSLGFYWTSSISEEYEEMATSLQFVNEYVFFPTLFRAVGASVRCIKDDTPPIPTVTNPVTGKTWMDRNLGASQVATSSSDADAYGDMYQWGRADDGHQIPTSGTSAAFSGSDEPGHDLFITSGVNPNDWRSPQNDNLWQGLAGINNPCPDGFRLPTGAEWDAEIQTWSSADAAGAFASLLKLPMPGVRYTTNGVIDVAGTQGFYWSSTTSGIQSRNLYMYSNSAFTMDSYRGQGFSVRCIEE